MRRRGLREEIEKFEKVDIDEINFEN